MIKQYSLELLKDRIDLVPQAIVSKSIFELADLHNFKPIKGHDDLDEFYGAAFLLLDGVNGVPFVLDGIWPFALMQYQGHPKNEATIYLPYELSRSRENILKVLKRILSEMDLSDSVAWQRGDDLKSSPPPTPPRAA